MDLWNRVALTRGLTVTVIEITMAKVKYLEKLCGAMKTQL